MPKRLIPGLFLLLFACFLFPSGRDAEAEESIRINADNSGRVDVSVELSDASLIGQEMSIVCYDPSWNGAYADWEASKSHIAYMGQKKIEGVTAISFKINQAVASGEYTLVFGFGGQRAERKFQFGTVSAGNGQGGPGGTAALLAPSSVKAVQTAAEKVKVSWKAVAGAAGYNVYRSTKKGSGYVKVGASGKTSYSDKKCKAGKTYYYKVSATAGGSESALGAAAKAKLMAAPKISVKAKGKTAVVSWKKLKGVKGYKVYSSQKKKGKYKQAANIKKASKTVCKVKFKKTCYIKVRAYKKNGKKTVYGKYSAVKKAGR